MIRTQDLHADAFLDDLAGLAGHGDARTLFHAEIGNDALDENGHPYAVYLDAAEGYDVLNDWVWLIETEAALERMLDAGEPLTDEAIRAALGDAAEGTIAFLQSYIGLTAPAVLPGGPRRPRHPGLWADRTRRLVNAYFAQVDGGPMVRFPNHGAGFQPFEAGGNPF